MAIGAICGSAELWEGVRVVLMGVRKFQVPGGDRCRTTSGYLLVHGCFPLIWRPLLGGPHRKVGSVLGYASGTPYVGTTICGLALSCIR